MPTPPSPETSEPLDCSDWDPERWESRTRGCRCCCTCASLVALALAVLVVALIVTGAWRPF